MKASFYLSFIFIIPLLNGYSQTNKKDFIIGGTFAPSYSHNNVNNYRTLQVALNAKAGYFILKNFAIGLNGDINYFRESSDLIPPNSVKTISFDPFVRYYIYRKGSLGGFAEGAAGYTYLFNTTYLNYKIGGGMDYFFNSKIALEVGVNYYGYDLPITTSKQFSEIPQQTLSGFVGFLLFL